jgi:hypothetical protein
MPFRTILAIYLAHLLADFVFQTHTLVGQKRQRKLSAYAKHGIVHYLLAIGITSFLIRGSFLSLRTQLVLLGLTLLHLVIDFAKMESARRRQAFDGPVAYISDQVLHLASIFLAAWLITPGACFADLTQWVMYVRNLPDKFLTVPIIYIAVVFGGGYLIRVMTQTLAEGVKRHSPEKAGEQLQNAGLYIGWLERFLVVTALLLHSPATVGLILTAKSIARYPEFKSERFAEYFLIGTLLSISLAITGGALLSILLFGQVHFS